MTVADEILLLNDGEVQQFGNSLDLYHNPDNEFVADFLGSPSMNLFDASIVDNGAARIDAGEIVLDLPDRHRERYTSVPHSDVRVGVRPESLYLGEEADPEWPAFEATVDVVETFGDFNWYYLRTGLEESLVSQSANVDIMNRLSRGDDVTVRINPESIHLFDQGNGEAYF